MNWIKDRLIAIKSLYTFLWRAAKRDKVDLVMLGVAIFILIGAFFVNTGFGAVLFVVYVTGVMVRFQIWKDKYVDFYYENH